MSFYVTNTGNVTGAEVPQLYIGYPESAGEPPKMLRRFERVLLDPEDKAFVEFTLEDQDFSIWDVETHSFVLVTGTFTAYVGTSSRDIRQTATFTVS